LSKCLDPISFEAIGGASCYANRIACAGSRERAPLPESCRVEREGRLYVVTMNRSEVTRSIRRIGRIEPARGGDQRAREREQTHRTARGDHRIAVAQCDRLAVDRDVARLRAAPA